jgi:hypothetical protein
MCYFYIQAVLFHIFRYKMLFHSDINYFFIQIYITFSFRRASSGEGGGGGETSALGATRAAHRGQKAPGQAQPLQKGPW